MQRTNKIKLLLLLAVILVLAMVLVFFQSRTFKRLAPLLVGGRIIEENLAVPDLKTANGIDGRLLGSSAHLTPLVPKPADERFVIPLAKLTLKQGLETAKSNAGYWSDDVKLVYAKSLGAVTLAGGSSQWLYVFGSAKKHSGLGVVVRGDEVIANLELSSDNAGYDLPNDWTDVGAAIFSLANSPDFIDRSIGGLALYYNEDSDNWSFGIALDKGQSVSMPLK